MAKTKEACIVLGNEDNKLLMILNSYTLILTYF